MEIEFAAHLTAVARSVSPEFRNGEAARDVIIGRTLETSAADLWGALTDGRRLARWFLPVTGNLEAGGNFRLEGNASGTILECRPSECFSVTWEFGSDTSWLEVRVADEGENTARLTLVHTQRPFGFWRRFGPGATGVGWEMALIGFAIHLADRKASLPDDSVFTDNANGRAFIAKCSANWAEAAIGNGTDASLALAAAKQVTAFYTGVSGDA